MAHKGMYVIPVGDPLLKQIRVAETQHGVTRVVLDLEQRTSFTASQLSNPNRLMIELRAERSGAPPSGHNERFRREISARSARAGC